MTAQSRTTISFPYQEVYVHGESRLVPPVIQYDRFGRAQLVTEHGAHLLQRGDTVFALPDGAIWFFPAYVMAHAVITTEEEREEVDLPEGDPALNPEEEMS